MKEELRIIPKKNYLILGLILIASLIIVYCFCVWGLKYRESKLNIPILNTYMEVINYNELDDYLVENPDSIIYVSVLDDSTIREFEKKFKKLFKNNLLDVDLLYLDITDLVKDKNKVNELNRKYMINYVNDSTLPLILVFNKGMVKDIYSVAENYYDVDSVRVFLNSNSKEDDING